MTAGKANLPSSLIVSGYKWLSASLLTAQQQYAVRPHMTCKIVDDLILPNAMMASPGQPLNGQVVTAPDGKLIVVGWYDAGSSLGIWIIDDASDIGQWTAAPTTTIENAGVTDVDFVRVGVSDWIGGTYVVDVYYTTSSAAFLRWKRSTDGGVTLGGSTLIRAGVAPMYAAAATPMLKTDGTVDGAVFYTLTSGGPGSFCLYRYYDGTTLATEVNWSKQNWNSNDWVIHSFDVFRKDRVFHIIFSGYHTQFATSTQYGIYSTSLIDLTYNVWTPPREILTSLSPSSINQNTFTYPTLSYDNDLLTLIFKGVTVDSVREDGTITTQTNYFFCQSKDFTHFTYPTALVFTDGTVFDDPYNVLAADKEAYWFAKQDQYYYLAGNGSLWQYIKNDLSADVTLDVIKCEVNEVAGAPSTVVLEIGNQNGKWIGPSPTETDAAAIKKNRKIVVYQGYYNASQVAETVPRNIFFIDDIKQNVSSNRNDLIITGRDWHKKTRSIVSRFAYSFKGLDSYIDTFDGTTLSNWNQTNGPWIESGNTLTFPAGAPPVADVVASLSGLNVSNYGMMFSIIAKTPSSLTTSFLDIYAYWIDSLNNLRLRFWRDAGTGHILYSIDLYSVSAGHAVLKTGDIGNQSNKWMPILIRITKSSIYSFILGVPSGGSPYGNGGYEYDPAIGGAGVQVLHTEDLSSIAGYLTGIRTIAVGANNFTPIFMNLKVTQFANSQNLKELVTDIATKAGIFDYKFQDIVDDRFFDPSVWTGSVSIIHRNFYPQGLIMRNDAQVSDGEIEFVSMFHAVPPGTTYQFDFIFRDQSTANTTNCYVVRFTRAAGPFFNVELRVNFSGFTYRLVASSIDGTENNVNIDLLQYHKYKVAFVKGWIHVYVDDYLVLSWYDNNTSQTFSTGYFGFYNDTGADGYMQITSIKQTIFYPQISSYAINPGDDLDSAILTLLQMIRAWSFSDLFGRFKSIILGLTDASNYTYENQLMLQQTDESDKEYANQITVIGNGVSAIARDNVAIGLNGITRDLVIVDYKIMTLRDAQDRANSELIDYNKFNAQSDPKQVINVGAEVLDVIHLTNTGDNSSNVDADLRVYNHKVSVDGKSNDYTIQLGCGSIL